MACRLISVAAALSLSSMVSGAWAHHSAAQFDFGQTVKIQGVVKELRIANPHTALFLEIKDGKGARVVEFEAHSRNNVYRRGWRTDMVHPGDTIDIEIAPLREGGDGGYVKNFILKNGTEF
ncbi:MAG: DUF6152 family protein [Gammaproteobacteria bacterium]